MDIKEECILEDGCFVHQLSARKQIQEMEEDSSNEYDYYSGSRENNHKDAITKLALTYGLGSKYTSFVGVDKATRKDWFEPAMSTRHVKQEVPFGYGAPVMSNFVSLKSLEVLRPGRKINFVVSACGGIRTD